MTNIFKKVFDKIESVVKDIFKSTTFEEDALTLVNYAGPLVVTALTIEDPALAPVAAAGLALIQKDLQILKTTVEQGQVVAGTPAATAVVTALNSVNTNITGLLSIAEVKNSASNAKIKAIVGLATAAVDGVLSKAPAAGPIAPVAPTPPSAISA